ncbi:hypothetical protein MRX96_005239 [Rhipicephalus microplus]
MALCSHILRHDCVNSAGIIHPATNRLTLGGFNAWGGDFAFRRGCATPPSGDDDDNAPENTHLGPDFAAIVEARTFAIQGWRRSRRKQDGPAHVSADRTETETSKVSATGTVKVAAAAKRVRLDDCVLGLIPLSISSILRHISLGPTGAGKIAGYETRLMMMRADGRGRPDWPHIRVTRAEPPQVAVAITARWALTRGPSDGRPAELSEGRYRLGSPTCSPSDSSDGPNRGGRTRGAGSPLTRILRRTQVAPEFARPQGDYGNP